MDVRITQIEMDTMQPMRSFVDFAQIFVMSYVLLGRLLVVESIIEVLIGW